MIPAEVFRGWVNKYDLWREFVFDLLSERLSTVMAVVDEVVFKRMDRRVAAWLLNQAKVKIRCASLIRKSPPSWEVRAR